MIRLNAGTDHENGRTRLTAKKFDVVEPNSFHLFTVSPQFHELVLAQKSGHGIIRGNAIALIRLEILFRNPRL